MKLKFWTKAHSQQVLRTLTRGIALVQAAILPLGLATSSLYSAPTITSERSIDDICNDAKNNNGVYATSETSEQLVDQCNALDAAKRNTYAQSTFAGIYLGLAVLCAAACACNGPSPPYCDIPDQVCTYGSTVVGAGEAATNIGLAIANDAGLEQVASQLGTSLGGATVSLTMDALSSGPSGASGGSDLLPADQRTTENTEQNDSDAACWITMAMAGLQGAGKIAYAHDSNDRVETQMEDSIREYDRSTFEGIAYGTGLNEDVRDAVAKTTFNTGTAGDLSGGTDLTDGGGVDTSQLVTQGPSQYGSWECGSVLEANGDVAACMGATAVSAELYRGRSNDIFKEQTGQNFSDFVNSFAKERPSYGEAFAAAAAGSLGASKAAEIGRQLEAKGREAIQNRASGGAYERTLASYSGGGKGSARAGKGKKGGLDIAELMKTAMGGLQGANGKNATKEDKAFALTFAKLQTAKPEEIVQDSSISIFTRVSFRYVKSTKKNYLKPMPWTSRYNRTVTGTAPRTPANGRK